MVDKPTARLLVYGALATLGLILIVAIYALVSKGTVQNKLEAKLEMLARKEQQLEKKERERKAALRKYKEAEEGVEEESKKRHDVEIERKKLKEDFDDVQHQKSDYADESERLRRKLWDKEDQQKLEDLENLSEAQLLKELEEEGEEFFGSQKLLNDEDGLKDDSKKELNEQMDLAKRYHDEWDKAQHKLNEKGDAGDEEALEGLEELGEDDEVYLNKLALDAQKDGKEWKNADLAAKMEEQQRNISLVAEALRNKYNERKLHQEDKDLDEIEQKAETQGKQDGDEEIAPEVDRIAKEIEADEERLLKELGQADEDEEDDAAKMLEEDAEQDGAKLAHLEQMAEDSKKLTPKQKAEREKLIKELENELEAVEDEGEHVEKGLERRHVRKDSKKLKKALNRMEHQDLKKLKHGKKAMGDAEQMINTEEEMLSAMKKKDIAGEEKYGRKLDEEGDDLEEDAGHLYDEADAGNFDDLDEKLIDEQLARELEDAGDDLGDEGGDVEHDDHARGVREEGEHIAEAAEKFGEEEEQFGKADEVKKDAKKVEDEARELGKAVGEQAWDEEAKLAAQGMQDVDRLQEEADDFEKELHGADNDKISPDEVKEDLELVKNIKGAGARLKHEAQGIKEDIAYKADVENQKLQQKIHHVKGIEKLAKKKVSSS